MTYLVNTNMLARFVDRGSSARPAALRALRILKRQGDRPVIVPQVCVEFWAVATRPAAGNGLGLTPVRANSLLGRFETLFEVLPESPEIYAEWRRLVEALSVVGRQVHDARLAASMNVYGISNILTFDRGDFRRNPGLTCVRPEELAD